VRGQKKSKPVGVLGKTFRIIDLLQDSSASLTLQEISTQTRINKSTALRLLAHLDQEKYLSRDDKGGYTLGPKLLQMGNKFYAQAPLREIARESLWELWRATQETVNLAVLDGLNVVYVDCLESPHDFRLVSNVGMRAVLYRTALGKAIVAFLPVKQRELIVRSLRFQAFTPHTLTSAEQLNQELDDVHQLGYAVDNEESTMGLRCIAAPVLDPKGMAVAAISISGPASRITVQETGALGSLVKAAAQVVSVRVASHLTQPSVS
jgi:DNA-binding IclR family transcriptional regulator